jgi:probable rRNA maturation factor
VRQIAKNSSQRLQLSVSALAGRKYVPALRRNVKAAHALLRSKLRELSIVIVPAAQMSRLHKKALGESGPTDVLSFELEHDRVGLVLAGEIVLCASVAAKNARRLGHPVEHELLLYAIHGMLHFAGFDDRTASAFQAMHAKEDQILTRLGIGPVFRRDKGDR